MNSIVTAAVTTPSTTQTRNVAHVNDAKRGRTMTSISTPAHASRSHAAPRPDAVDQRHGDREADLHAQHRPHRHRGAGASLIRGHSCIERYDNRSRPRDFHGHTVHES